MTVTGCPPGADHRVSQTAATRRTPGTAVIARWVAGVTGASGSGSLITTSAPVVCQDAAASPLAMAAAIIPAKVARLSASTSANTGSTLVSDDLAAPASATKP